MAGLPMPETVAAISVPMAEIMQEKMLREMVVARMLKVAMEAAPIKTVKTAAVKSASESRPEAGVGWAATGDSGDLRTGNDETTSRRHGERLSKRHPYHSQHLVNGLALSACAQSNSTRPAIKRSE